MVSKLARSVFSASAGAILAIGFAGQGATQTSSREVVLLAVLMVVTLLLGLGQFTAPLLLGSTAGVNVITTDIYRDMSQTPVQYGSAAALVWRRH